MVEPVRTASAVEDGTGAPAESTRGAAEAFQLKKKPRIATSDARIVDSKAAFFTNLSFRGWQ